MKISNFRLTEVIRKGFNLSFKAKVTVTKGIWFWKTVEDVEIYKEFASFWIFLDTGRFTPNFQVETLVRAYCAKHGKSLEDCPIKE